VDASLALAMAALGLASSVHCAGMCGGIVTAFSARRVIPIGAAPLRNHWIYIAAFNAGRISTYSLAGAAAGLLGSAAYAAAALPLQTALYTLANVVLVLIGLQLAGLLNPMAAVERIGAPLWQRLQPLAVRLAPARSLSGAYAAGLVWGWLPCGLVYGALTAAVFAGSPAAGALAMLAFGIGTLPSLFAAGLAATQVRGWLGRRAVRTAAGSALLGFGVYGLAQAGGVADGVRQALLCF
jgi:hypothetical protein